MLTTIAAALGLVLGCVLGFVLARRRTTGEQDEVVTSAKTEPVETEAGGAEAEDGKPSEADEAISPVEVQQQHIDELEARGRELNARIEDLETDMRRLRRRAGEHLQHLADELEGRWSTFKLKRRVHDLDDDVDPEQLQELRKLASPMGGWMSEFGLGSAGMFFQMGLIEVLERRFEDALRSFERAAFDGMVPEGWLALADCQWILERPKTAAKTYQRCLEHKRMPVHAFQRVAEVAVSERRYEDALHTLRQVMSRKQVPEEAFVLAALASRESGDAEGAIVHCEEGLKRFGESSLLHAAMIIPLSQIGEPDRAESCASRARDLDPELPETPYSLGVTQMSNGEDDAAVELFEEALMLREDYPEALCCLGVICNRRGQFKEALEYFKPAVEAKPDFAEAYFNMKESYEGLRDFDNAIVVLNRAVQLNPDYS